MAEEEDGPFMKMLKAKEKMTPGPGEGYNLVGVDDYEAPGEELYLVAHFETKAEAEAEMAKRKKSDPSEVLYVYGEGVA